MSTQPWPNQQGGAAAAGGSAQPSGRRRGWRRAACGIAGNPPGTAWPSTSTWCSHRCQPRGRHTMMARLPCQIGGARRGDSWHWQAVGWLHGAAADPRASSGCAAVERNCRLPGSSRNTGGTPTKTAIIPAPPHLRQRILLAGGSQAAPAAHNHTHTKQNLNRNKMACQAAPPSARTSCRRRGPRSSRCRAPRPAG